MNVETVRIRGLDLTCWDLQYLRIDMGPPAWRIYYSCTNAVIFMVDSNDRVRIAEANQVLVKVVSAEELKDVPFVVFANKQDLPHSFSVSEVRERMDLDSSLSGRQWHIQPLCTTTGDGIYEGMDWLCSALMTVVMTDRFGLWCCVVCCVVLCVVCVVCCVV